MHQKRGGYLLCVSLLLIFLSLTCFGCVPKSTRLSNGHVADAVFFVKPEIKDLDDECQRLLICFIPAKDGRNVIVMTNARAFAKKGLEVVTRSIKICPDDDGTFNVPGIVPQLKENNKLPLEKENGTIEKNEGENLDLTDDSNAFSNLVFYPNNISPH